MIAPVRGFERVGAVDLPRGADMAFAFIRSQSGTVPPGFYTLRGYVDEVRLGFVPGRIQFIDELGQVAGEIPARVEVHSLNVPKNDRLKRVVIMATSAMQGHFKTEGDDVWIFCSNGQSWHYIEVATENN